MRRPLLLLPVLLGALLLAGPGASAGGRPVVNETLHFVDEPFSGIGKPEPLKHAFQGYWSRRINDEHRIVYKIQDDSVLIAQIRYHY